MLSANATAAVSTHDGASPDTNGDQADRAARHAGSAAMPNAQQQAHADLSAELTGKAQPAKAAVYRPPIPESPARDARVPSTTSSDVTYRFKSWSGDASVNLRLDLQFDSKIVLATPSDDRVRRILDASLLADAAPSTQLRLDERDAGTGDERRGSQSQDDAHEDEDAA